jgi:hypothetical protein
MAAKSRLLVAPPPGISTELNTLLGSMTNDVIAPVTKSDSLILELAKRQYTKAGHEVDQHDNMRSKLRELGRLLIQLRIEENNSSATLESFIDPRKIRTIIKAVHVVAGFDDNTHSYKTPSLAIKIGHSIKKCAWIVKANALEKGDKEAAEQADAFHQLCEFRWETYVSTHAYRTLYQGKRNNPQTLPTNSDVVKMSEYIHAEGEKSIACLLESGASDRQS